MQLSLKGDIRIN